MDLSLTDLDFLATLVIFLALSPHFPQIMQMIDSRTFTQHGIICLWYFSTSDLFFQHVIMHIINLCNYINTNTKIVSNIHVH